MVGFLAYIGCGTTLLWVTVSAVIVIASIVVVLIMKNYKKKKLLRESVLKTLQDDRDMDSQLEEIDRIIADSGYAYDCEQNIYYSVMNPWQREMGYFSLYDEWATPLGMVFDSEPVCFNYNGSKWLIEFWKGQYGITIGGEIGIYNSSGLDLDVPGVFKGTFYKSVSDEDTLDMSFTLRRNRTVLFNRAERHWWLTGFILGEYSDPSLLTMDASVTFRDPAMCDAFVEALYKLGYEYDDIELDENSVQFTFTRPHSKQPSMRHGPIKFLALQWDKSMVNRYKELTNGMTNMYDILMTLKVKSPQLYRLAINIGRQKELFRSYEKIRDYLI